MLGAAVMLLDLTSPTVQCSHAMRLCALQSMAQLEAKVFQEIGQGGFDSDDFEIMQQLGKISVQQVRPRCPGAAAPQYGAGDNSASTACAVHISRAGALHQNNSQQARVCAWHWAWAWVSTGAYPRP